MDEISALAAKYKQRFKWSDAKVRSYFSDLYVKYVQQRKKDILDSVAVGIALESLLAGNEIDVDAMPDNVQEAFHDAFPNLDIHALNDQDPAYLADLVNAWKGKLFEVEVRDQLNAGEQVGDWQLEAGQHAELASSATQPGWDLSIMNDDGSVADVIQLKATNSASYVHDALERYPDVPIVTTSDIHDHGMEAISASDLSNHDVTSQVSDAIDTGDSVTGHLIHTLPASVIAATEAYHVATGSKTVEQAVASGGKRVATSAASGAVGWIASLALGPFAGVIAAIATRLWLGSKVNDTKRESGYRREKVINPMLELPSPKKVTPKKPATTKEAQDAFKRLAGITDRLRLEYKGS